MATVMASATIETTSPAFAVSGVGKLIASGLAGNEYVILLEEYPDGVYRKANDKEGTGIVLTAKECSKLFEGYGNYKVYKPVTAAAVIVNYES